MQRFLREQSQSSPTMLRPITTWVFLQDQGKLDEAIEAYNQALSKA